MSCLFSKGQEDAPADDSQVAVSLDFDGSSEREVRDEIQQV